ncbi:MAG: hypothetical protein ABI851_15430 [Saprospiraceae bacterium]
MKKVIILLLLVSTSISAQMTVAVTGGVNYSNYSTILFENNFYPYNNYKYLTLANLGFELNYSKNNFILGAGLTYSNRGSRVYGTFFENQYLYYTNDYLELPLKISYSYCKRKFDSGFGLVLHNRLNTGFIRVGDGNQAFGLDLRLTSSWNLNRYLAIVPSYTFGNLDKTISNTKNVFVHHVFALNLRYTFMRLSKSNFLLN